LQAPFGKNGCTRQSDVRCIKANMIRYLGDVEAGAGDFMH
jgi:hypothetical protein